MNCKQVACYLHTAGLTAYAPVPGTGKGPTLELVHLTGV